MNTSKNRSANYYKQVKGSVLFKVGAITATFLAMPIMIRYLGAELFGIWATMLTLINWVVLFDLGVGNGLKNKVSECLAQDNIARAVSYISTAYVMIGFIALFVFSFIAIISLWVPWQVVFNTQSVSQEYLRVVVVLLSFFVLFNFWISLVHQLYHGLQKSSMVVFGQFVSNVLALLMVFLFSSFTAGSIKLMVYIYGFSLLSSNVLLSVGFLWTNKNIKPTLQGFDKNKIGSLMSLGAVFFIIQVAVLVIFMTDKILITQLLGPQYVTPYEVLFKLFSVFTIIHGLLLAPLWPAYTDAFQRGDLDWMRSKIKQQIIIALFIFFGAFSLAAAGPVVVKVWVGDIFKVSNVLYYYFAIFIVLSVWSNVFAYFVNAINHLKLQLFTSILAALINIPLSIYFVKFLNYGLEGVVSATIISLSLFSVLGPLQVYLILKKRDPAYENSL